MLDYELSEKITKAVDDLDCPTVHVMLEQAELTYVRQVLSDAHFTLRYVKKQLLEGQTIRAYNALQGVKALR